MTLRTLYSVAPFHRLREEIDRRFAEVFEDVPGFQALAGLGARVYPAVNVWEDAECVYAEAELPGMKLNEIEVLVVGNELTFKGQRKDPASASGTYHRRERPFGDFTRTIRLPVEIDAAKVEATLHDGVLTVTMPKAPSARPRKITVESASS